MDKESLIKVLQLEGIKSSAVLAAIRKIPRENFIPPQYQDYSYANIALPIKHNQTISQPYIVALMTEALALTPEDKVLEIGTGSGYQTAILAKLCQEVYSIERIWQLHQEAKQQLRNLRITNVKLRYGDGTLGWEEFAPYDAIIITAATPQIPNQLLQQLKIGGRMVVPIELGGQQILYLIAKTETGIEQQQLELVRFVPILHDIE